MTQRGAHARLRLRSERVGELQIAAAFPTRPRNDIACASSKKPLFWFRGLGLDVLDDCAPSAALLLLVGHDFSDCEALLATRGAHLPEAETLYVGRWKVGVRVQGLEWELGAELTRLGQVEDGGGRETGLPS